MSGTVTAPSLASVLLRYRLAYLMTTSGKGAPHVVQVSATLQGNDLVVHGFGRRSRENARTRPAVGLLWPPESAADYSLIVDGQAVESGDWLRITPTRAVLHRASSPPAPGGTGSCGSDCVELALTLDDA